MCAAIQASAVPLSSIGSQSRPTWGIWRTWSITHTLSKPAASAATTVARRPSAMSSHGKAETCSPIRSPVGRLGLAAASGADDARCGATVAHRLGAQHPVEALVVELGPHLGPAPELLLQRVRPGGAWSRPGCGPGTPRGRGRSRPPRRAPRGPRPAPGTGGAGRRRARACRSRWSGLGPTAVRRWRRAGRRRRRWPRDRPRRGRRPPAADRSTRSRPARTGPRPRSTSRTPTARPARRGTAPAAAWHRLRPWVSLARSCSSGSAAPSPCRRAPVVRSEAARPEPAAHDEQHDAPGHGQAGDDRAR